jgi:hypothetical protein
MNRILTLQAAMIIRATLSKHLTVRNDDPSLNNKEKAIPSCNNVHFSDKGNPTKGRSIDEMGGSSVGD